MKTNYVITREVTMNGFYRLENVIGVYSCYKQMDEAMKGIFMKTVESCSKWEFENRDKESVMAGIVKRVIFFYPASEERFTAYCRPVNESWGF